MRLDYPEHFRADPDYQTLVRRQNRLSYSLSALILALTGAFILGLVYAPGIFGMRVVTGTVFTVGLLAALLLMLVALAMTGYYLHRVRVAIDPLRKRLLEKKR